MRETLIRALAWALELDPATLKWPAAVLLALCFGLVLFGLVQYQAFNRRWGIQLVLGLAGGAVVVGLGAAIHWFLGVLYGVGYLLTWLVWVLTRRWHWWRQALARGLTAGLALGPWLWLGATEKALLLRVALATTMNPRWLWLGATEKAMPGDARMPEWLLTPNALLWFWMLLGVFWALVLVGGWGCWRWPLARPQPRRWLVATWAVLAVLGLNWYLAGRMDLLAACRSSWHLGYVLVSRPGSQWYRSVTGWTPLHWAASGSRVEVIRLLLAAGTDVHAKDKAGALPLHWAARFSHAEACRLLLAAGAQVNGRDNQGRTALGWQPNVGCAEVLRQAGGLHGGEIDSGWQALHEAAYRGNAETLRALLAAGADVNAKLPDGRTPLHVPPMSHETEVVRVLLAAGAQVNVRDKWGRTTLDYAHNRECRELLERAGGRIGLELDSRTPLHEAAEAGNPENLRLLLAAGADVNATTVTGSTPLHWAAAAGRTEAVRLLLAAGADATVKAKSGATPLHTAARQGHLEALRLLLAAGANPNVKARDEDGQTPLHCAARGGQVEVLRLLLAAGADPNVKDRVEVTPLYMAVTLGHAEALRVLLAAGAQVNERDGEGKTALDRTANADCREVLRQAGGKTGAELDAEKPTPTP